MTKSKQQRPISPHLSIYKPQISSSLSILHRVTGVILFASLSLLCWFLILATFFNCVCIIDVFHESLLFKLVAFATMYALFFHLCMGIRHLFWNIGKGFEIKTMHFTGYFAVGMSLLLLVLFYLYIIL